MTQAELGVALGWGNKGANRLAQYETNYRVPRNWPAHPPVGMWFNYGVLNDFMKEWILRKEELKSGKITRDEYFEWKINWPQTCDGCGKFEPKRQWKKKYKKMVVKSMATILSIFVMFNFLFCHSGNCLFEINF